MTIGIVKPVRIEEEMKGAYLDYAMSVITARALPDVRDGLKPVQRRILYSMDELGLRPTSAYKKSARIVGEVMGKYHPHGDAPVYEAMVRLAQDFSMRYPLVDGQGNFGSVDGDPPAAMRYTEARLTPLAEEMLADIDKDTVNFTANFDDTLKEPAVLPSKLPNLLVNGSSGIAVGMATNIPPHNIVEVAGALKDMIGRFGQAIDGGVPFPLVWARAFSNPADPELAKNAMASLRPALKQRVEAGARKLGGTPADVVSALIEVVDDLVDITPARLMEFVKGPDFPTAGILLGAEGIKSAYATGHGRLTIRAKVHTEDMRGARKQIIVTELPFQVNKASLLEKIAELVRDRRVEGISELRDESDREGMRIVIELRRDAHPRQILNQLFKYTAMQTSFSVNMLALVDGQPRVLTLKMVLLHYLNHRREVITRRTEFDLAKAKHRAHILEGLKIALDNLDEVIATIRRSKDAETARAALIKSFKLSEIQAQAILDMQLRRLAALERQKIRDEYAETLALIKRLEDLLAHPVKILYLIRDELDELKTKFGDVRRTQIVAEEATEFTEEDLVPDQEMLITVTAKGYVKRSLADAFRTQRRGAKAVVGAVSKEDDPPVLFALASSRDNLLLLSNRGRAYQAKVYDLPEATRQARGTPLGNFVSLEEQERVIAALPAAKLDGRFVVLATKRGDVKRTSAAEFSGARPSGIAGYAIAEGDELVGAVLTSGHQDLLIATTGGQAIRFGEAELRSSGRGSGGVRGIRLGNNDHVASIDVARAHTFVAVQTRRGFGKRTVIEDFSKQGRGGSGIRAANVSLKNGEVVAGRVVAEADEMVLVSSAGTVLRLPVAGVPEMGRAVIGAPVMTLGRDEKVIAVGVIPPKEKDDQPASPLEPSGMGAGGQAQKVESATDEAQDGEGARAGVGGAPESSLTERGAEMVPGARLAKAALRGAGAIISGAKGAEAGQGKRSRAKANNAKQESKTTSKSSAKSAKAQGTGKRAGVSAKAKASSPAKSPAGVRAPASSKGDKVSKGAKTVTGAVRSAAGGEKAAKPSSGAATTAVPDAKATESAARAGARLANAPAGSNPMPGAKAQEGIHPPAISDGAGKRIILSHKSAQEATMLPPLASAAVSAATAKNEPKEPKQQAGKAKPAGKNAASSPTLLGSLAQTIGSGIKAAKADIDKHTSSKKPSGRGGAKYKQPDLPL